MHDKPPMDRATPDADTVARGYEARDVNLRAFVWLAVGFGVAFALMCGCVWWLYDGLRKSPIAGDMPASAVAASQPAGGGPPLQPQVGHESLDSWDLAKMRQGEDATFAALGWARDEQTHRFTVPAAVMRDMQQRAATQPATQAGGSTLMDAPHIMNLLPESASNFSVKVDALLFYLLGVCGFFAALILVLIVYFSLRYRRRRADDVPAAVPSSTALEIAWMVIPLGFLLVMFGWGAKLFIEMRRPPADAETINVQARRWMWTTQHSNGSRQKNELTVPLGRPVRLLMTSEDVIHDFYIPAFRTKQDVLPDHFTEEWFTATKPGTYEFYCSEYCGTDHSQMRGRVVVMEPAAYDAWLVGTAADLPPATVGAKLFQSEGCNVCHGQRAPTLYGIFGKPQLLDDGSSVVADESYIRESILVPAAKVVAGYKAGNMPSYSERLTEEQLAALIAYIKALGGGPGPYDQLPTATQPVAQPLGSVR